jgi:hypothetical protein
MGASLEYATYRSELLRQQRRAGPLKFHESEPGRYERLVLGFLDGIRRR